MTPTTDDRRRTRTAATVGLVLATITGTVVLASVLVVRNVLLDGGTYRSALVEADAYERVYTDVMADPELAAVTDALIGRLTFAAVPATQVRAKAVAALRWAMPPSTLRQGTERVVDSAVAYVRGDVDRVDGDVDVAGVLARVAPTAVIEVRTELAATHDRVSTTVDAYRGAVADFADELAAGRVPAGVPVVGGTTIGTGDVLDSMFAELGPLADGDLRRRITSLVLSGDERDAMIEAAAAFVTDHALAAGERLRADRPDRRLDVVDVVASRADTTATRVVGSLDEVRDIARAAHPLVGVLGGVVAAAGVAGLAWVHRRHPRRALVVVGGTVLLAAGAWVLTWEVATHAVGTPLGAATSSGAGSWNLPPSVRALVADVRGHVASDLRSAAWRIAVVLLAIGVTVLAVGLVARREGALRGPRVLAVALTAAAVVGVGAAVVASRVGEDGVRACNGHPELCGRRYDDVVYAATHNSMSSPDVVAVWPEHDGNIRQQLDAGVRALLIDAKYWTTVESAQRLVEAEPLLPPAMAEVVFGTLGDRTRGRDGTFLCHIHCAFGEIEFVDAMVTVRQFLEENPDEVVTFILQDEIAPSDTEAVMRESGLEPYLHVHDGGGWPTLGDLVDRGERLVVLAENQGPPPAWHHDGFDLMQETPFLFREPEDMSCDPNRGNPDATLFQMNHWVQRVAPDRVDATIVNAHDFIVERARRCEAERGLRVNVVGVNFYNIGDLMAAVDTLNGVGDDP